VTAVATKVRENTSCEKCMIGCFGSWVVQKEQKECVKSGEDWKTNAILRKDVKEEGKTENGGKGEQPGCKCTDMLQDVALYDCGPIVPVSPYNAFPECFSWVGKGDHAKLLQNDTYGKNQLPVSPCTAQDRTVLLYGSPPPIIVVVKAVNVKALGDVSVIYYCTGMPEIEMKGPV